MSDKRKSEPVKVARWKYDLAVALVLLPGILLMLVMFVQGFGPGNINLAEYGFLILLLAYYGTSIEFVQTDERAGIMIFEQAARETGPGLYFVPRFIAEMDRMPASTQQDPFPADPEKVSKRDDDAGLLPGEFRPIRAMTAAGKEKDGDDPLNTRLTLEVTFAVRWRLKEGRFFDLYVNIPGRRWKDKLVNIRQHMRDTGETELLEEIAERTPFEVIAGMQDLNDNLKLELQNGVKNWGIEIEEARMQAPDFPHDLNIALSRVAESRANRQAVETEARTERFRLAEVGQGEAEARIANAEARKRELAAEGEGKAEAAKALGISGEDYYAGDIAKETIGQGDVILGAEGISQAVGLGKYIFKSNTGAAA